jgi:hypothetical protein
LKSFIHHPAKEHLSMADKIPSVPTALLDLDTLTERPFVIIDGVRYELPKSDELSVLTNHRLTKLGMGLKAIEDLDDPSESDDAEYERLLKQLCDLVLIAPDDVKARLLSGQRVAVAMAFTQLRRRMTRPSPAGALIETEAPADATPAIETASPEAVAPPDNETIGAS